MKVVVTGGSGQLGSLVLARLIGERKVKRIVSLDLAPPRVSSPKLSWKIADVRDPGLDRHLEGADALVHLAFVVWQQASTEKMYDVNVEGSRRMFDYAVAMRVPTVVYASSVSAYGLVPGHPVPIVESTQRRPTGYLAYADNKLQVEQRLDEVETKNDWMRIVRMRPGVLIGRHMPDPLGALLRRRMLPRFSDARLPLVWDEDVADAFLLALLGDVRGAFNLVADEPEGAEALAQAAGMRVVRVPSIVNGLSWAAPVLGRLGLKGLDVAWLRATQEEIVVSSERAKAELGWAPTCATCREVMQRFADLAPRSLDPRIRLFLRLVGMAGRSMDADAVPKEARQLKLLVHLELLGARGGDFSLSIDEGQLSVRSGVPRPPDAIVSTTAQCFIDMLAGSLDVSTARFTGKLKVRGDPTAGFVLSGMIEAFRAATRSEGARGYAARKLQGWFQGSS